MGTIYQDPRGELFARTVTARKEGNSFVAVPVDLASACATLRECHVTKILEADENGPLPEPMTITCINRVNHDGKHYDGYTYWES